MTKHTRDVVSHGQADEIGITPEMIKAGADRLADWLEVANGHVSEREVSVGLTMEEAVAAIYRAMTSAARAGSSMSPTRRLGRKSAGRI